MDREDEESLTSSMAAFAAALQPKKCELRPATPQRLLLALDGSGQDAAVRGLGQWLSLRTGAPVVERTDLKDGHQVIAAAREAGASAIILPAPFGEEYEKSEGDSLGSVADVVLADAALPVLVVRAPVDAMAIFKEVVVPFSSCDEATQRAAGWAFATVAPGGRIHLLDVPDVAVLEEARRLLGDQVTPGALDAAALERAASKEAGALVAAAQRLGSERDVGVDFTVRAGHSVDVVLAETQAAGRLAIIGLPKEPDSPARHRAHDLAARSRTPVLLV